MNRLWWALAAVLIGLTLLTAGLYLAGYDPGIALVALFNGAFGSWYAFTSATLVRAVPLILIGLGIAIAFRGGSFNIGGEGQFYAGAIAATWIGLQPGSCPLGLGYTTAVGRLSPGRRRLDRGSRLAQASIRRN